jgi:hypothetical protein
MPRIAQALEAASRSVDLEQGDFERLLGRQERKLRNRRIRAGAVGVIVALALGTALVRSLSSAPIPAVPPDEIKPAPAAEGALAYILDGDVYVADPDGSNAVKIADGAGDLCATSAKGYSFWAEGSMWSPDGRYLAYRRVNCSSEEPGIDEDWGDVVISDAAGNVLATFRADGWDIGWSPDSSRVAVWDTLFEKVAVYGVDGTRHALVAMPSWWGGPSGDHDPAWLRDGTLGVDYVEIPSDGGAARRLDSFKVAELAEDYLATIGQRVDSPDGSRTAEAGPRSLLVDGSKVLTVERGTHLGVIDLSPGGDRILFSRQGEDLTKPSLWSVRIDGSDPRLIVAGTIVGDWFVPSV